MSRRLRTAVAALLTALTACAGPPAPQEADAFAPGLLDVSAEVLADVIAEKSRLADLEYALDLASAALCGELVRPQVGAFVGGKASLQKEWLRSAALRDHAIADALTVLHVVPGGPFDRAGLRRGDAILAFEGAAPRTRPELKNFLFGHPELAEAHVRVRRGDREFEQTVALTRGCPILFELGAGSGITTWQSSKITIVAPRGLLRYADDDDLLAVVLGHQLGHALFAVEPGDDLAAERRADRIGAMIAARAGYRVSEMVGYWEDVARAYPWLITPAGARTTGARGWSHRSAFPARAFPHHDIARRMQGMRDVVAAIEGSRTGSPPE